jgi:hypothetical protein
MLQTPPTIVARQFDCLAYLLVFSVGGVSGEVQVSDLQRLLKFSALPWSREDCMAMIKLADPDATYV